jgi:hypothetical protein
MSDKNQPTSTVTLMFVNQSMSPIEHPTDKEWDLIGSALATQCKKFKEGRGRDKGAKSISKKGDVAAQRDNVAIQGESVTKG